MHITQAILAELETIRKNQTEVLPMKNTVMELKNAFNGLLSMHGTAEQRIIVLECRSTEITQNEKPRQKFRTQKNQKKTRVMVQYQLVQLSYQK